MLVVFISSGAIIGQIFVGLICDRIGRKAALMVTTLLIVIGATIGTAAHGAHGSVNGLLWCLTFGRGITGVVGIEITRSTPMLIVSTGSWGRVSCFFHKCQRGCKREDGKTAWTGYASFSIQYA